MTEYDQIVFISFMIAKKQVFAMGCFLDIFPEISPSLNNPS